MANKENISLLSKYQMMVLYYKCKEGATHEEIAKKLGRDVNTIQYHMTKIYRILEISEPGKSKEEMDSELKNEICPIIRQMFQSIDDVKIWAPIRKTSTNHSEEESSEEITEPKDDQLPSYQPPPSVERVLRQAETPPAPPVILESPPPARARIHWGRILIPVLIILVLFSVWRFSPRFLAIFQQPTDTPIQPIPTQPFAFAEPTEPPTSTPAVTSTQPATPTASFTSTPEPIKIVTQVSAKDNMVQVYVPAGEFKMGSSRADDPQALEEELPQHIVYLDAFWMDQSEVTNAQYALCVADSGACTKPADNISLTRSSYFDNNQFASYPVIFVSWGQASAYCAWAGRRLPTEAEWEKAARGPDGRIYPWGNEFDGTKANYCDINCNNGWKDTRFDDGYTDTSPVGDYPAGVSVFGVFDMAGNVYEWVADWYEPYSRTSQNNPTGPASGQEHIIRGGSWGDDPAHIRAAVRSHINTPDYWMNFIGFRCAAR